MVRFRKRRHKSASKWPRLCTAYTKTPWEKFSTVSYDQLILFSLLIKKSSDKSNAPKHDHIMTSAYAATKSRSHENVVRYANDKEIGIFC